MSDVIDLATREERPPYVTFERKAIEDTLKAQATFAKTAGATIGLTEDETREVLRAWQSAYQATMDPLDWNKVRSAIVLRACGEEWRP